ncbi:MAG: glycosyltransferase family 39 protein, partial [Deltaproteobacteria bacterium]|nr:glycosyltransferase family 39 protein [Deltaproteobacteria bacterium]
MSELRLLFALFLPTLVGFLFASWLLKNDEEMTIFDRIFFGYGLGLGFISYSMFILGISGIKYTLLNVIFSQVLFIVGISALFVYSGTPFSNIFGYKTKLKTLTNGMNKWKYFGIGLIALWILFKVSFVLYEGLNRPIYSWDVWANWAAGAKFIFYEKGLNLDLDSEFFFGKWYRAFLGHPLHNPLLQVWVSLCLGEFHEIYAKAWTPFYFISLLGIFFFAVKRDTSLWTALIATLLLSSAPLLTYHATDAYSDLPMGYYALAGVITLWRYIKTGNRNLLFLSGVFIGIGVFTKNEGVFFAAA